MGSNEVGTDIDEAPLRQLFAERFDEVWRFARRRCASSADADDIAAETFAVAWRRRHDLPPGDEARLWLFATARLVLANQQRSERRRSGLRDRLAAVPTATSVDPADVVADGDHGLAAALAALAADDRDLLVMRAWDGMAVADIAVLLGCTPNAVSLRLTKARRRLADALTAENGTEAARCRTSQERTPMTGGDAP